MSRNERIPIKIQVFAQIIPTANSSTSTDTLYECTLEKSQFEIKSKDEIRLPLTAILRRKLQVPSSSEDESLSEHSSQFSITSERKPALVNLTGEQMTTNSFGDSLSRLTNLCFAASDFSKICFQSDESQNSSDINLSPKNSSIIKWVEVKRRSTVDQTNLNGKARRAKATKLVVAINLNNLYKPPQSEKAVQADHDEPAEIQRRKSKGIFDETIVKDSLQLYEKQLQPLKQGFQNLKDTLATININLDSFCTNTPETSPRVSAEAHLPSAEGSPRVSSGSLALNTPRRSPLLEQHFSVFNMQRISDELSTDRESEVIEPSMHLADADPLSQDQIVETIKKEFEEVENEEREAIISEPKISS